MSRPHDVARNKRHGSHRDYCTDPALSTGRRKRRYRSAGAAKRAAADFTSAHGGGMRAYQCPRCGGFHLTTMTGVILS